MKRVTIKDIAKIAGVSYATVSRALSDSPEISSETRRRIKEICEREGYRANTLARSLISSRTNVIGLIVPDISNAYYSEMAYDIETFARSRGYNVMLCNNLNQIQQTDELFSYLVGHQADGIILASSRDEIRTAIAPYCKSVPVVLLGDTGSDIMQDRCIAISVDNQRGGEIGLQYLAKLGHTEVCYLGHRPVSSTHVQRLAGVKKVAQAAGVHLTVIENPAGGSTIEAGHLLGKQFFSSSNPATAVFAATDSIALGLLQAADEFNVRIPDQLSVIGFDNAIYAGLPRIELTTIDQRKREMAELAVNRLIEEIARKDSELIPERLVVEPQLIVRSTCTPPAK